MPFLQTFDLGKGEHGWSQRIRIPAFFNKTVSAVSSYNFIFTLQPFILSFACSLALVLQVLTFAFIYFCLSFRSLVSVKLVKFPNLTGTTRLQELYVPFHC